MNGIDRCHLLLQETGLSQLLGRAGSARSELYLVGGALRDALLGSELKDLDFVSPDDPTGLARKFAGQTKGRWFWLDEERRYSRVVFQVGERKMIGDFTPFRGRDLIEDLTLRDFTLNAMAIGLHSPTSPLIDPLGGQVDLQSQRLRHCSETSFEDDPLRILRGVRFSLQFGFSLDRHTQDLMVASARQIRQAAAERITAEMVLALGSGKLTDFSRLLISTGLAEPLFHTDRPGTLGFDADLLARGEALLAKALSAPPAIKALLEFDLGGSINRLTLIRLFWVLASWDSAGRLPEDLQLPGKCRRLLKLMFQLYAANPDWNSYWRVSKRSSLRRLEAWQPDPTTLLLLHWLIRVGLPGRLAELAALLEDFHRHAPLGRLQELIGSEWMMRHLAIERGPIIGRVYRKLHQAELSGEVQTADQAEEFLRREVQKGVDKG